MTAAFTLTEEERDELLAEKRELEREHEELMFPPLRPADPSRANEVWVERVRARHVLERGISHCERLLEEGT